MDDVEFIRSEKGKLKLKYTGYIYVFQKKLAGNRQSWECEFRRQRLCKAKVQLNAQDQYYGHTNEHTHAPNIAKLQADTVIANIRHRARTTLETPQQIITQSVARMDPICAPLLPQAQSLRRETRRVRRQSQPALPIVTCAADVVIPPMYQVTHSEEQFLFYDSGIGNENRMLIFASTNGINLLRASSSWACDGTFKTCPEIFYQFYSVHATCQTTGQVFPCVYALLINKRQNTYEKLLDMLLEGQGQMPTEVIMDFEMAAKNAFEIKCPGVQVEFCFFHLCQNTNKKVLYAMSYSYKIRNWCISGSRGWPES